MNLRGDLRIALARDHDAPSSRDLNAGDRVSARHGAHASYSLRIKSHSRLPSMVLAT